MLRGWTPSSKRKERPHGAPEGSVPPGAMDGGSAGAFAAPERAAGGGARGVELRDGARALLWPHGGGRRVGGNAGHEGGDGAPAGVLLPGGAQAGPAPPRRRGRAVLRPAARLGTRPLAR